MKLLQLQQISSLWLAENDRNIHFDLNIYLAIR